MHEKVRRPCLMGCGARAPVCPQYGNSDELIHYLRCPILWSLVRSLCPSQICIGDHPVQRLGLAPFADASPHDLRATCLASWVYHYVKNEQAHLAYNIKSRGDAQRLFDACFFAGKIFASELF